MERRFVVFIIVVVSIAVTSRLLPHPPNFTAMGAVALFAGTYLPRRWGVVVPLVALFLTDFALGFYEPLVAVSVYGSFALVGAIGLWIRKNKKPSTVLMGALSASVIFFFITNFAVWAFTPWYPKTAFGLYQSYALAVPFFRNMLAGDLIYTILIFGLYEVAGLIAHRHLNKSQLGSRF